MKPVNLLLLPLTFALILLALPIASPTAAQNDQGRIVFVSERDGNEEIYVMNPDGSGVTRLTNNPARDMMPAWSPDGTKIVFVSDRDAVTSEFSASQDIYVMNADGSGVTRLVQELVTFDPAWSPDGQRIAFAAYGLNAVSPSAGILVMNADGTNIVGLATGLMHRYEGQPAWSPDGTQIAFASSEGRADQGTPDIYIAPVDGSSVFQLTTEGATTPAWSPDGSRIAFVGSDGLYVIGVDGNNLVKLSDNFLADNLTWSPDGTRIAFDSDVNVGSRAIFVMSIADSTQIEGITPSRGSKDDQPDWSRAAVTDALLFPETGHSIAGRIRSYWEQNGGLPVFGYPITDQQAESIEGQTVQAQWFERNRLELHPENQAPYDVLLGRLGVDRLAQYGYDWQSVPYDPPQDGCRYFAETGRNVCGDILAAWRANGLDIDGQPGFSESENLALFGLPITGLINETLNDGRAYQVQYFERARFELHPENAPPYNVLLGLLGIEVRGAR